MSRAPARRRRVAEGALRARTARRGADSRAEGSARTAEVSDVRCPGIMYTNQASGSFKCTFVSDNVDPVMGFSAWEMLEDPKILAVAPASGRHAAGACRGHASAVAQGGGTVEYRFRHRDGNYLWIQDTFKVIPDETTGKPLGGRRIVGQHLGSQAGGARPRRTARHYEGSAGAGRCQPLGHLYDAGLGRLRLYFRQRQPEVDHGLRSVGDAR